MKNNKKNSKIIAGLVLSLLIASLSFFKADLPQPLREYLGGCGEEKTGFIKVEKPKKEEK